MSQSATIAQVEAAAEHAGAAIRLLRTARAGMLREDADKMAQHDSPESWAFYRLQNAAELLSEVSREFGLAIDGEPKTRAQR